MTRPRITHENRYELPRYIKMEYPQWYFIHYIPGNDDKGWTEREKDLGLEYYVCRKKDCAYGALKKMDLATHMLTYHGETLRGNVTRSIASRHPYSSIPKDESGGARMTCIYMRRFPSRALINMRNWPNTNLKEAADKRQCQMNSGCFYVVRLTEFSLQLGSSYAIEFKDKCS
ncbi:hypothetical protein R1sor_012359 [Riccia sorocarpa]|uniref:C2H2-type domain-containing protein n=1 Tax=Riccia sorocarpa TaxID=122646 RepID=A0ABD3I3J8_9MARC